MKYFAKYLPVEGEIKEGDKVFYTGKQLDFPEAVYEVLDNVKQKMSVKSAGGLGIEYTKTPTTGAYLKIGYNIFVGEHLQKVKLFLCSRDIQVVDKVFCLDVHYNNPLHPPEKYIDPWRIRGEGDTCKACIKVIGEISPEAVWVKEGDEFDEDQVEFWIDDGEQMGPYNMNNNEDKKNWNSFDPEFQLIKIKGPCGHVH